MPAILRSIQQRNVALAASTQLVFDLPVNPISAVLVTLRARDLTAVTAPRATLAAIINLIATIEVQFKGAAMWSLSALDGYVHASALLRRLLKANTPEFTATSYRFVTLVIPFTRVLYATSEGFPATRRGELRMIITPAASFAGFDTVSVQVETIEMLDSQPVAFIKSTTLTRVFPATGPNDIDFPLGNPLLGATLFATTPPLGGALSGTMIDAQVLVDNVNFTYASTLWETLQNDLMNRIPVAATPWSHRHTENLAAVYAQAPNTDVPLATEDLFRQYAYMDWDPKTIDEDALERGTELALITEGRGRVIIRVNAGVADTMRVIPAELVRLQAAA